MNKPCCSYREGDPAVSRAGFTLIEVALAMAVVVVGVLALFSLISAGLDASAKALEDTHAAQFADNVFNGLRSRSQAEAEKEVAFGAPVPWRVFWKNFAQANESITLAASNYWDVADYEIKASLKFGNAYFPMMRTNVYKNYPQHSGNIKDIANHALRYRIEIRPPSVTTWSVTDLANDRVQVTMYVWPGQFGSTNDPLLFYSEFDNPGDL